MALGVGLQPQGMDVHSSSGSNGRELKKILNQQVHQLFLEEMPQWLRERVEQAKARKDSMTVKELERKRKRSML